MKSYITASVALTGAGVLAAAPVAPPTPPDVKVVNSAVSLAASSVANIPVNLFYAIVNIPAVEVEAMNNWADALEAGGSWWVKTPTNVWGWDPGNPPMLQAAVSVLVPFPTISGQGGLPVEWTPGTPVPVITSDNSTLGGSADEGTLGYMLNVLVAAEMPMHKDCGFNCADFLSTAEGYFRVPIADLLDGYTFDVVDNPNGEDYPPAWSGQTIEPIDPLEPFTNFLAELMEEPEAPQDAIKVPTPEDLLHVGIRLFDSGQVAFNPFVEGTFLFAGFPAYGLDILVRGLINGIIERTISPLAPASVASVPPGPTGQLNDEETGDAPGQFHRRLVNIEPDLVDPDLPTTLMKGIGENSGTASTPVDDAKTTTTSIDVDIDVKEDGDILEPAKRGKNLTRSGERVAGAVKSFTDGISSAVSKATDGLTGGAKGDRESDGAGAKGDSPGGTGNREHTGGTD